MQTRRAIVIASAAVLAIASAACTKSESGTPAPEATTTASVSSIPASAAPSSEAPSSASAGSLASAAPSASAADPATSAKPAAAQEMHKTDGGAATAAASASAGPAECGKKPLPDCPLQAWMKANANPPVMTSNLPALAIALDKIAGFAPPSYTNWASISKDGAAAARNGDLAAAKASCRSCHDQYKQKYKTEMRDRKI